MQPQATVTSQITAFTLRKPECYCCIHKEPITGSVCLFMLLPTWSIEHPRNASLQFLNLRQSVGPLGQGSAYRKAATYTQTQTEHSASAKRLFHFSFLILDSRYEPLHGDQPIARPLPTHKRRPHDPSVQAGEDTSCLRA
jgi:hypothetical protein